MGPFILCVISKRKILVFPFLYFFVEMIYQIEKVSPFPVLLTVFKYYIGFHETFSPF